MAEPLTAERLAEIRARCEAASPGPWASERGFIVGPNGEWLTAASGLSGAEGQGYMGDEDGAFAAAARTDIPDLLAEIERLTAERDLLQQHVRDWLGEAHRQVEELLAERDALRAAGDFLAEAVDRSCTCLCPDCQVGANEVAETCESCIEQELALDRWRALGGGPVENLKNQPPIAGDREDR